MAGNYKIFVDFGSTFTKLVAFDLAKEELAARVQVPSTVDTDITIGLEQGLALLAQQIPIGEEERRQTVACSSAAGGLRVICLGLVPEYTTEAARMAALGAGAKLIGTYSYELSRSEAQDIEAMAPDIILLTGGTDGGNKKNITHNAKLIAGLSREIRNIIVAGNKTAYDDIQDIFDLTEKNVIYTNNVMPEIGKLNVGPVNQKIRELFIQRITDAKGITRAKAMIHDIIMPTPSAVMEAAKLLADGLPGCPGLGELLLVDVGGATTDVYSIASGLPTRDGVSMVGLPQPYAKRTVEGDLGLYHNLDSLAQIAIKEQPQGAAEEKTFNEKVLQLRSEERIPAGAEQIARHLMLSQLAVKTAVERHVGRIEIVATYNGDFQVQRGKDLSEVQNVIGAGGPIAFSANPRKVLEGAMSQEEVSRQLKPRHPKFLLDTQYIFFAVGLLAQSDPQKAYTMINKYLAYI
ncbi:MAG: glutamate mutase L [Peptococcaceae bacterium]|jgi:uncharacterized protein (TIGR01319 family)|nr:glutamate mutase L [Peptococcaceae bacterium]